MKERAREAKGKSDGEGAVLEKIAEMPKADRVLAERLHAIIRDSAPALSPRTWYGMPAYAKDGRRRSSHSTTHLVEPSSSFASR